jgi:hypothetical protein
MTKKSYRWKLIIALTFIIFIIVWVLSKNYFYETERAELFTLVKEGLQSYYKEHGCYPEKLTDLEIRKFPKGTSPSNLKKYNYRAKCKWFVCENKIWNRVYILSGKERDIKGEGFDDEKIAREWVKKFVGNQ